MKYSIQQLLMASGAAVVFAAGCGDVDDAGFEATTDGSDKTAAEQASLTTARARWQRPRVKPPATKPGTNPGTGGSAGTAGTSGSGNAGAGGTSADGCAICAKAKACCDAVRGGTLCTHSVQTCSSMSSSARPHYVNACRTLLDTVDRAHSDATLPASCR